MYKYPNYTLHLVYTNSIILSALAQNSGGRGFAASFGDGCGYGCGNIGNFVKHMDYSKGVGSGNGENFFQVYPRYCHNMIIGEKND